MVIDLQQRPLECGERHSHTSHENRDGCVKSIYTLTEAGRLPWRSVVGYIFADSKIEVDLVEGKTFRLFAYQGTLVDLQTHSETTITSSGGGGYIGPHGGHYQSPTISSNTSTYHDLFIKGHDGKEQTFRVTDLYVPSRLGHSVTVIWGVLSGKDSGHLVAMINHDVGSIKTGLGDAKKVLDKDVVGCLGMGLWLWMVVIVSQGYFSGHGWLVFASLAGHALLAAIVVWVWRRISKVAAREAEAKGRIENALRAAREIAEERLAAVGAKAG